MDDKNNGQRNESVALASFICGIVSLFIFPLAFGGAAIIFGLLVQGRLDEDSRALQNARLGIIFGIVGLVLWIASMAAMGLIGVDAGSFFGAPQEQPAF